MLEDLKPHGMTCWPYGDSTACDAEIMPFEGEGYYEFEIRASEEGWRIGHYDGEGFYVCPDCQDCVWDPMPFWTRELEEMRQYMEGRSNV